MESPTSKKQKIESVALKSDKIETLKQLNSSRKKKAIELAGNQEEEK